jgi:hypothetical protein
LRDIDKLFTNIKILLPQIDIFKKEANFKIVYTIAISNIYIFLLLLKIVSPKDYNRIINKDYKMNDDFTEMLNTLNMSNYKVKFKNYSQELLDSTFYNAIRKFLELNSFNLENEDVFRTVMIEKRESYDVGLGNEFRNENLFNLILLWSNSKQSSIIRNLMFTNVIKV